MKCPDCGAVLFLGEVGFVCSECPRRIIPWGSGRVKATPEDVRQYETGALDIIGPRSARIPFVGLKVGKLGRHRMVFDRA